MEARDAANRWAATWRDAWERLDVDAIVALYHPSAVFWSGPFREPDRGRDGVRNYVTQAFGEERGPRVWMSEPIVDGERASISWWSTLHENGVETSLAGTSVLRFDGGLVVEQWDTWHQLDASREPPDGTPLRG